MTKGKCPMCGASVSVATTAKEGDLVYCDACDAELEIVSLKPLELDWPLDEYDYDYDYDYDDEEYEAFDDEDFEDFEEEDEEDFEEEDD